jgi:uncharacterized protein (TIGR03435 family)
VQGAGKILLQLAVPAVVLALALQAGATLAQSAAPNAQNPTPAAATPASPNEIVGIWQGTLHIPQANKDLRIEIKIAKDDKGGYKTAFYSIDQGGQPIVATKTTFENGALIFTIDPIGGKYEGKMSADGKTITGTWTQGPMSMALNLERVTPDAAWPIPEPAKPMAADANPGFEVATIKPSQPGRPGKIFTIRGQNVLTMNTNLNDLLAFAYGVHAKQIVGAPEWAGSDLFDINGVPDVPGVPNLKQMGELFQKLLADRFQLKFHHEQRELSVYILTVAPGGSKLGKTTAGPNDLPGFLFPGFGDLRVRNESMQEFSTGMQSVVMDKPVVDRTGLTGKYDFTLKWTPDDSQFQQFRGTNPNMTPPAGDNPDAPPSLYTAVQEQLGLKIEAGKAMDDVIVIDHVEKPSPN